MLDFSKSLYIQKPDVDEVLLRISECQLYSEILNQQSVDMIKKEFNESGNSLKRFMILMKHLNSNKNRSVMFHIFDNGEYVSIFSDFFYIDGAFDFSKKLFDDVYNLIVSLDYNIDSINVSIKKASVLITEFTVGLGLEFDENLLQKYIYESLADIQISKNELKFLNFSILDFYNICTLSIGEKRELLNKSSYNAKFYI